MPRPIDIDGYSVIYLECSTVISDDCNSTPESGTNKISVDQNPQRYDSGRMFSINFAWNPHDPTAAENDTHGSTGLHIRVDMIQAHIAIPLAYCHTGSLGEI
ncbi:hypothetical protein K435DRAFT_873700 [Dendrothele bispora CBS 962.96]|uniref:Uncharacterized protein n=1 Tax=Dendrothele bispora (strain CBS 962.96) TaxID=1314807 RepID=A0A4S8KYH3_DENBC|nr:hypothetical protein K435DRAFT_873700 [Dendrothele bispora CBS 962.96]